MKQTKHMNIHIPRPGRKFACIILLSTIAITARAQFPLEVQVNVMPPYPVRLSDFTDIQSNTLVTIQNNTQSTYTGVYLTGSLTNTDNGASISTDLNTVPGICIDVPPGVTMLTGPDLKDLFNPDNLVYRGLSIDQIRGDQALPEGRYKLCVRVRECYDARKFLSAVPEELTGCSDFEVQYVDPPVITTPCEEYIPSDRISIPIAWTQIIPAGGISFITYTIRIVEVEPATRNPYDAINTSPPVFTTEVSNTQMYNLMIPDDVLLEEGRKYAIRITARDEDGRIVFKNRGESEVCTFTFGTGSGTGTLRQTLAVYPADGDVIPFSFFPFIIKYEDYSDRYNRFHSEFTLSSGAGVEDTHIRDLNWGRGPLESQRIATGFSEMTQLQAQHIAVYKNQTGGPVSFAKTKHYTWQGRVEIDEGSTTLNATVPATGFRVGMGPSILALPANKDTIPPGDITFRWKTADAPSKLFPGMDIVQADGSTGGTTFFNGFVDERWVIEVSREETFATILHTMSGRLGGDYDLFSDEHTVKAELYKDEEEIFNITTNGKYYWRVRWMVAAGDPGNDQAYASSPVFAFVISDSAPSGPVAEEPTPDDGACVSNCIPEEITDRTAVAGLTAGSDVTVGKFTMNVHSITGSSGNRYTGEGVVTVPFLNNVKILVAFTGIQINAARKVFSGTVEAREDRSFVTEEVRTSIGEALSMSDTEAEALHGFLDDGDRVASFFSGSREIGMPIGIDKEIDGKKYIVGITHMTFGPGRATLDAVMRIDFPEIGDYVAAFGVKELCINPNGLGDEGRLYLARDLLMGEIGETRFAFKGSETADTTQATYVSWDCRGFKCMQVRGEITFPRSMLVPDNADGTAGEGNVKGTFGVKACRGGNWIAAIHFDPFQVKGLEGWGWNASTAYIDFSDVENPPGFRLPAHYGDTTLTDARLVATWQGFYMERTQLRLPPEFASNATPDARTSFGVEGVIIDRTGLTASVRAYNILEVSEGNFEGWGFAIDTVNIDFVSNTFTEAGMAGRLSMPIFDEGDHLKYSMALGFDDGSDEFSYQFRVYTRDTLNIPMWGAARMFFKPNSSIEIGLNDPDKGDHITATLHGGVHLEGDFGEIASVAFKGINFEGLYLSTHRDERGRYFKADSIYFAHASPQKSAAGFPVNIDNINLNVSTPTRPGIEFDLQLLFSEGSTSIGAGVTFGVFATFEKVDDHFDVGFGGVDVSAIHIDVDVSTMHLEGELEFFRDDPTYGNGTHGSISVTLPMDISGRLEAYFGTVGRPAAGGFGSEGYYAYWLVDGMLMFPKPGIQIFSGFAIYGFGGGAYYHMTMDGSGLPNAQATLSGEGRTSARYVPDFDTGLGLKFVAVLGTSPSSEAFNMDVRLQAEFTNDWGMNFISVGGDGYFMASISERGDAKVWADVEFRIDFTGPNTPRFLGNFNVYVRVGDFLRGAGTGDRFVALEMYAAPDKWYVYLGTPENHPHNMGRGGLVADLKIIQASLTSYLMVGHDIPLELPPLPDRIQSVLGGSGGRLEGEHNTLEKASTRTRPEGSEDQYLLGEGFAFGAALAITADLDLGFFYAILGVDLGFDLNFTKPKAGTVFCAETGAPPRGIDGWYIRGQVFAGLYGEMGVQVNLFFIKGRVPFIQLAAAAVLDGNFPDPSGFRGRAALQYSVLGGMLEGRCNFEMSFGERCTLVTPNPLAGMDFIADIVPENGSREQSCFATPAVSFNLPVEKILEFPTETADGVYTRVFYPYIDKFEFKTVSGNQSVLGRREFESNNAVMKYVLDEMLTGQTEYEVTVLIKAREHLANGTQQQVRNGDGSIWQEERTVRFTTGDEPDYIPLDQVVYTYPVEGQYYFLKGEGSRQVLVKSGGAAKQATAASSIRTSSQTSTTTLPLSGVMQLLNPVNRIFLTEIDGKQYRYLVRYIPVGGGEKIEKDLAYSTGRTMTLPMPPLENETMYAVQLVRKLVPREDPLARARSEIRQHQAGNFNMSNVLATANVTLRGNVSVKTTGQNLLPGETVNVGEKLLYKFYFRTSRYNTLREKLDDLALTPEYNNLFIAEQFTLSAYLQEPFDEFEISGLHKNGRQVMKPMLDLAAPWTYRYHTSLAGPGIYDVHREMQDLINRLNRRPAFTALNTHGRGLPPQKTVTVSDDSRITSGISQWQIEREARSNPDYSQPAASTSGAAGRTAGMIQSSGYSAAASTMAGGNFNYSMQTAVMAASPRSNFELKYASSAYVWADFNILKRSIAAALAWRVVHTSGGRRTSYFPVSRLLNGNSALNGKVARLLRQNMASFRYTRGSYGVQFKYLLPRGNNSYQDGTSTIKTFSY